MTQNAEVCYCETEGCPSKLRIDNKSGYCRKYCKNVRLRASRSTLDYKVKAKAYAQARRSIPEVQARQKLTSKKNSAKCQQSGSRMLHAAKARSKKQDIAFNLTIEDIIIPTHCPLLGYKLEFFTGKGVKPNTPSLDKIVPDLGYVKGNVRVISFRANAMKQNSTLEEFLLMAKNWKRLDSSSTKRKARKTSPNQLPLALADNYNNQDAAE